MLVHDLRVIDGVQGVGLFLRHDGGYDLHVPHGLEPLSAQAALALLFKTFVVFRRSLPNKKRLDARDGVEQHSEGRSSQGHGASFCDALALDELFDRIDPRAVLSLCDRQVRFGQDVPRRFERHLHHALFDNQGVAHFDRVPNRRRTVLHGQTDIVGLYCVLALDFYRNFLVIDPSCGWGAFAGEGEALANDFRHRYLTSQDSLYHADAAANERSREQFRHLLVLIDRASPVRNAEYRNIHDALYRYLHAGLAPQSGGGQVWGVRDFWAVWESICLHLAMAQDDDAEHLSSVWTCDDEHLPHGLSSRRLEAVWAQRRTRLFARNEIARRPDLVRRVNDRWTVADFKYYAKPHARRPKWQEDGVLAKDERDFLNLELYGLMLRSHLLSIPDFAGHDVNLEMWLPGLVDAVEPMNGAPTWDPPLSIRRVAMRAALESYAGLYGR